MSVGVKKWVYLLILSFIWGSSYILIKKGLVGLSPVQLGASRILMTTIILLLVGFKSLRGWSREQWKWMTFTGFFGTFFPSFLFAFSETEINSSVVAVLNGLTPTFTLIIAFYSFNKESKKDRWEECYWVYGHLAFSGTRIYNKSNGRPSYALLVVIAALCYGINVNAIKYKLAGVSPMAIALANFIAIAIPALILLLTSSFPWSTFYNEPTILTSLGYIFILSLFGTALQKFYSISY